MVHEIEYDSSNKHPYECILIHIYQHEFILILRNMKEPPKQHPACIRSIHFGVPKLGDGVISGGMYS